MMNDSFTHREDNITAREEYADLCKQVKSLFSVDLPSSFDEFKNLDVKYVVENFGNYFLSGKKEKSELYKKINIFFKQHNLSFLNQWNWWQQQKEIEIKKKSYWIIPFPWSYSGYRYLIKNQLRINLPQYKYFTQEAYDNLLLLFQRNDGSYESELIDHGTNFIGQSGQKKIKNQKIDVEKEPMEEREQPKDSIVKEASHIKKIDLISKKNGLIDVIQEINHSDINYVSEWDYRSIQRFLKYMTSRSQTLTEDNVIAIIELLDALLEKNPHYWKSLVVPYIINWKFSFQKIKSALDSPYFVNSTIYRYLKSFQKKT